MEQKDFKEYEDFLEKKIQKEKEKSHLSNIVPSQLEAPLVVGHSYNQQNNSNIFKKIWKKLLFPFLFVLLY